jgi:PPM family protein phosphatase
VELLTIGAFARASCLSPKALRLYDELGLLQPARVDPASGYRLYDPAQLERARLVAWLRRLGMPLARIRMVCDSEAGSAAAEVAAYWAQVTADVAARSDLAAFLVDYLSGRATAMSDAPATLGIRFAARSDIGLVRERNEDRAYASARLLAVADGLGGHHGGSRASSAAINALQSLEDGAAPADPLAALGQAVRRAGDDLRAIIAAEPSLEGLGTTLTAMLWSGSQLALAHIGDSRAYVLREGELFRLTKDHSYVQSLVDEGRISAEDADSHPQRALLIRALDGATEPQPDLSLHPMRAGDRYLLCTDGLTTVAAAEQIRATADSSADPEQAVGRLIDLANSAGGPDNVACVVADIVEL